MKKHFIIFSFVLCFSVLTVSYGHGKDGDSDVSFGTGGKVITSIGKDGEVNSVAIQPDGKIVVAGYSYNSSIPDIDSNCDIFVLRYNSDGSLDTSFGTGGKVTTSIGNGNDAASSVAIQPDGKIVVAGWYYNGTDDDIALIRYNSNGSQDTSFGTDGKVTTAIGNSDDWANSMLIQPDGKIVVAGGSINALNWNLPLIGYKSNNINLWGANCNFALVRYNSNGSLDTGFGSGGKVTTAIGNGDGEATEIAIQADGKIIAVGTPNGFTHFLFNGDTALVRYNSNGSLDTAFGTGGKVTPVGSNADVALLSAAIQPDGKIIAAGYSDNGSNHDIALLRYNNNGSSDTSFGEDGKVITPISSNGNDIAYAMKLQPDGKIVVTGYSGYIDSVSNASISVVRYNSDGSSDASFGTDGKAITSIENGDSIGNAIAIQPDGKIVVAGDQYSNYFSNWDAAVVRYENFKNPCITVGNDLVLNMCATYQNTQYEFMMNFYSNPNDSSGLYWKIDIPSFKTLSEKRLSCFQVNNDPALNICAEYQGGKYGFRLDLFPNSYDPDGLYWKMNLNTVTQQ